MKAWVVGATGFLGRHLALELARKGHDLSLFSKTGGEVELPSRPALPVRPLDIFDSAEVSKSARGAEVAFLCAGLVSRRPEDAEALHHLHVTGVGHLVDALVEAGVKRVVLASTSGTIAIGEHPKKIFTEGDRPPLEHISRFPYYRSKYYGERRALEKSRGRIELVIACPSLLLGPGDLKESSTGDVRRFLERSVPACPPGGLAFVDVRDAARGLLQLAERGRDGERYFLNAGNFTLRAFFDRLSRISGVAAPALSLPSHPLLSGALFGLYEKGIRALGGVPPVDRESVELGSYFWYCSAAKAEQEVGFVTREPNETLRDTVLDLRARRVVPEAR